MKLPSIDKRDWKDILNYIKQVAPYYIPEWKIDETNSDFGWTFSVIFSTMFEETINRFNQVPYNNYISFLNLLGAELLPSSSAQGYIAVEVIRGAGAGVYIKKGTQLYAVSYNEAGKIIYETQDDIYAVDNRFSCIYCTSSEKDKIIKLYDETEDNSGSLRPFNFNCYDNLQEHKLYICCNEVLNVGSSSKVMIELFNKKRKHYENLNASLLGDPEHAKWSYLSETGWEDIRNILCHENKLTLFMEGALAETEIDGVTGRWLSCEVKKLDKDANMLVTDIRISSSGSGIKPDYILSNDLVLPIDGFLPYGESLSIYDDFYIASEEVFSKRGAVITLKLDLDEKEYPVETIDFSQFVKYKPIMEEADFLIPKSYNITIDRVVWEYWNGNGWTRLLLNEEYEKAFYEAKDKIRAISFICPDDIEETYAGAHKSYFIRARLAKINNAYKTNGFYICPYVNSIEIDYSYKGQNRPMDFIIARNNMECTTLDGFNGEENVLLSYMEYSEPSLYFGMDEPITSGPVKIFFDIEPKDQYNLPALKWQFYGNVNGQEKWYELNVFDGTNNFSNSGTITIIGKKNFQRLNRFGIDKYWIRLVNSGCEYDYMDKAADFPIIKNIYFNAVKIFQQETQTVEYFYIENQEQNKICQLSRNNLVQADVWVNEYGNISIDEMEKLQYSDDLDIEVEKNADGSISGFWVKWLPIGDILTADHSTRCYRIDYTMGKIIFGNGVNGKIPTSQINESIRIKYRTGEGKAGNMAAGEINSFAESIPFISRVYNFKPLYGGLDQETVDKAVVRCSNTIKHLERAVTLDDYENIIHDLSRNISRVRCIPHVNFKGDREIGALTVVILPVSYNAGYESFSSIRKLIFKELNKRASSLIMQSQKLYVVEAKYISISVQVKVIVHDYNDYQEVYRKIESSLEVYLNPVCGNVNGGGWRIGEIPDREKIDNYLKRLHKIKRIKKVNIFTYEKVNEEYKEIPFESVYNHPFVTPISGQHDIDIEVEG